jgi:hypothetical protein
MLFKLSPRQRWELAVLLFHRDLKMTGSAEVKLYNRTRLTLGLTPIQDLLADSKTPRQDAINRVGTEAFDLTDDQITFLLGKVFALPLNGSQAGIFGSFIEDLETAKLTRQAPDIGAVPMWVDSMESWVDDTDTH